MEYYETLYEGGSCTDQRQVYIHLYANTADQDNAVNSSGIATQAIEDAMSQLLNASAISKYEILRFKTEEYTHPDIYGGQNSDIEGDFRNWLQNSNGTGQNLYSILGVHHLVEDFSCDTVGNGAEGSSCGNMAFSAGVTSWSSVSCADEIARNAAIQEPVHQLIDDDQVDDMLGSDGDEHSLGKINFYNDATPMITFHENEVANQGSCSSSYDWGFTHTQELTSCTEEAVDECGTICSGQGC